jgi:hypothetical protein
LTACSVDTRETCVGDFVVAVDVVVGVDPKDVLEGFVTTERITVPLVTGFVSDIARDVLSIESAKLWDFESGSLSIVVASSDAERMMAQCG